MENFWTKLDNPFLVLAPMYDVTDSAFRQMFAKYGKPASPKGGQGGPNVFYTEFVSADGLASDQGRPKLLRELYFTEAERPIVAQIFGSNPENIYKAARLVKELGFDGLDINMGCPDRSVEKQGAGAALMKNPTLAKEIIKAAKEGAGDLPVSVKTRLGYNKIEVEKWCAELLSTKPAVLTFHLRTRKEMSKVPAQWEQIKIPVEMAKGTGTLIVGNGDVSSVEEAKDKAKNYGVDGVMIGRGIFGNPFFFSDNPNPSLEEKLQVMVEHAKLFWHLYGPTEINQKLFGGHTKNFAVMRKHFGAYVRGFPGAAELREQLMQAENPEEVEKIVTNYLSLTKELAN